MHFDCVRTHGVTDLYRCIGRAEGRRYIKERSQAEAPGYLEQSSQVFTKIQSVKNLRFSSPRLFLTQSIPMEINIYSLSFATPTDLSFAAQVCQSWQKAAAVARRLAINNKMSLRDVLPPWIKSVDRVIEWIEKNVHTCSSLTYGDFRGFADFNEEHLNRIIKICPKLTHLFINSGHLTKIESYPKKLQVLNLSGSRNLNRLTNIPEGLKILRTLDCWRLKEITSLPNSLREFDCSGCRNLLSLPALPENLTLICEDPDCYQNLS